MLKYPGLIQPLEMQYTMVWKEAEIKGYQAESWISGQDVLIGLSITGWELRRRNLTELIINTITNLLQRYG